MKLSVTIIGLLIFLFGNQTYAQDEIEDEVIDLHYGGYVGALIGNGGTAIFYSGDPNLSHNSVERVLQNEIIRDAILIELNHTFELGELPQKMSYKFASSVGFFGQIALRKDLHFGLGFGYALLKTSDQFRLNYTNLPPDHLTMDTYFLGTIVGAEKRYYIDFDIEKVFPLNEQISVFAGVGVNFNNVEVIQAKIQIGNLEYDIKTNYMPYGNNYNTTPLHDVKQGAIGMGGFANFGMKLHINEYFSLDPGVKVYYAQNRLPDYDKLYFHFLPYVRFNFLSGLVRE